VGEAVTWGDPKATAPDSDQYWWVPPTRACVARLLDASQLRIWSRAGQPTEHKRGRGGCGGTPCPSIVFALFCQPWMARGGMCFPG
jgi:hypothetical protein